MPRAVVPVSAGSVISAILAAQLSSAGTITLNYPNLQPGTNNAQVKNKGHFFGVGGHRLMTQNGLYTYPTDFELTFNAPASGVTLTWRNSSALPAGTPIKVQLNEFGGPVRATGGFQTFSGNLTPIAGGPAGVAGAYVMNLGAGLALAAADICAAQAAVGGANAAATINGTRAVSGVGYMDLARAVSIVSSNAGDTTQIITVRGTDLYGQALTESIAANGTTTVNGKKAFFTITSVRYSANLAGNLSVGTSDVLGLPVALNGGSGYVLKELQDGAAATAGTFVAAASVTPTATTADVRGTYVPNAATNGTRALQLVAFLPNPGDIGGTQFSS